MYWMVEHNTHINSVGAGEFEPSSHVRPGLYPAVRFRGSMKLSGGTIVWPKATATSRGTKRRADEEGSGRGVTTGKILKFETQFGAVWCILTRN